MKTEKLFTVKLFNKYNEDTYTEFELDKETTEYILEAFENKKEKSVIRIPQFGGKTLTLVDLESVDVIDVEEFVPKK